MSTRDCTETAVTSGCLSQDPGYYCTIPWYRDLTIRLWIPLSSHCAMQLNEELYQKLYTIDREIFA